MRVPRSVDEWNWVDDVNIPFWNLRQKRGGVFYEDSDANVQADANAAVLWWPRIPKFI